MFLFGCFTNDSATRLTLQKSGYSEIEITGYSMFECGDGDMFHTGFRAKNPIGNKVEGTVCCGLFTKGCTIRY
jgi:hypothetical protein